MRLLPLAASLLFAAMLAATPALAQSGSSMPAHNKTKPAAKLPLTEDERALHMLNRFTFGPRPGDMDAVRKIGVDAWFEQQLNPDKIADTACDKRLADYPALALKPADLLNRYPSERILQLVKQGKRAVPSDPLVAAIYATAQARADQEKAERDRLDAEAKANVTQTPEQMKAKQDADDAKRKQDQLFAHTTAQQLLNLPKEKRMGILLSQPVADRITFFSNLSQQDRGALYTDATPLEREAMQAMSAGPRDVFGFVDGEMQQAKLLRAVLSERQLQEVMTDFWFNHFNVYIYKDADRWYTPSYERDVIRPRSLGKFKDLLLATAQDPAMLTYLDNWQSIGPDSPSVAQSNQRAKEKGQPIRGLNENYGREVMELHTVSVNGGYSQSDVTNLAKILTGWTIDDPGQGSGASFDPRKHEPGDKKWFGQTIKENGYLEGKQAILWLAAQPQTAHFISLKLAERFVADDPPRALVDRMATAYLKTDGDIREVLRAMVHSPEFFDAQFYRAKVKTPLEFVASSLRATGTNPADLGTLTGQVSRMGEPLYAMLPPTGYSMMGDVWMNSSALINRLNFSLALANTRLGALKFDSTRLLAEGLLARPAATQPNRRNGRPVEIAMNTAATAPSGGMEEALGLMENMLIGSQVSAASNQVIRSRMTEVSDAPHPDVTQTINTMTALILGSPEFQMR